MLITRCVEKVGVCILFCAAACLLLLATLLWYGRPTNWVVEISLILGLIGGIAWSCFRRPSLLAAALAADRQWQTAELISTAWLCRRNQPFSENAWFREILIAADSKCRDASAFSISVRRLDGRAWGVVGLVVALVIALGIFGFKSADTSPGGTDNRSLVSASGQYPRGNRIADDQFATQDNRPILMADPQDLNASHFGQNTDAQTPDSRVQSANPVNSDVGPRESAGSPGTGAGSARTESPGNVSSPISPSPFSGTSRAISANNPRATPAGGTGIATSTSGNDSDPTAAGLAAGSASGVSENPPWTTKDWPADVERANSAVNAGRVPAEYHDLVRGYFEKLE